MENEIIIIGVCALLGFIIAVLGLTRGSREVTHENRAEVCRGLFDYFMKEE